MAFISPPQGPLTPAPPPTAPAAVQEILTPPQGMEEDPDVYVPRLPGLRTPAQQQQQQQQGGGGGVGGVGGDTGCGVHEVVLLVDGVDEAEGPSGLPHDNRSAVGRGLRIERVVGASTRDCCVREA